MRFRRCCRRRRPARSGSGSATWAPFRFSAGVLATLAGLIELNNQYYPDYELSISTGIATNRPGDHLEQVVKRADMKSSRQAVVLFAGEPAPARNGARRECTTRLGERT